MAAPPVRVTLGAFWGCDMLGSVARFASTLRCGLRLHGIDCQKRSRRASFVPPRGKGQALLLAASPAGDSACTGPRTRSSAAESSSERTGLAT